MADERLSDQLDALEDLWDEVDGGGCCALVEGHDGCCAYTCSMCNGTGRTDCFPDDLGCDCGFCDGYGYCEECSGNGWFNEFGDPCMAPSWREVRAYGTCDWGGCDAKAQRFRWSDQVELWLPVCASHFDAEPEDPDSRQTDGSAEGGVARG